MTQKFQVGDRMQVIFKDEVITDLMGMLAEWSRE